MTRVHKLAIVAVGCLALLIATPVLASSFLAMSQDELVAKSAAVVEGRVVKVESFWDETGKVIVSEALVEVAETYLGKQVQQVKVRTFGGEVDGYVVEASGFPKFVAGEEVVLFLHQNKTDQTVRVTGYQLGHYRVAERGGIKVAVPTLDDSVRLLSAKGLPVDGPTVLSLDELEQSIREIAREQASR